MRGKNFVLFLTILFAFQVYAQEDYAEFRSAIFKGTIEPSQSDVRDASR